MRFSCTVSNETIEQLIVDFLKTKLGKADLTPSDICIKVRSKQNYRVQEWEVGELQVTYEGEV